LLDDLQVLDRALHRIGEGRSHHDVGVHNELEVRAAVDHDARLLRVRTGALRHSLHVKGKVSRVVERDRWAGERERALRVGARVDGLELIFCVVAAGGRRPRRSRRRGRRGADGAGADGASAGAEAGAGAPPHPSTTQAADRQMVDVSFIAGDAIAAGRPLDRQTAPAPRDALAAMASSLLRHRAGLFAASFGLFEAPPTQ
jgi:hypothetical protein